MKKLLITFVAAFAFAACATNRSGIWKLDSADAQTDQAIVKTAWGRIEVKPREYMQNLGMFFDVTVVNESQQSVEISTKMFKLQNDKGEILDAFTEADMAVKVNAAAAFSSAAMGASFMAANAVTTHATNKYTSEMLKEGVLPSASRKSGTLVFEPKNSYPGNLTFRVVGPAIKPDGAVRFISSEAKVTEKKK